MAQLILSEKYIRANSIINNNVDMKLLTPLIITIQDWKLRPLLGSNLYDEIITETTPGGTLTTPNAVLVNEFILPCLNWYLVAECLVSLKFRLMNKGIMESSSDNSSQSSTDDLKFIENRYSSLAESYGNNMTKYIRANPTLYPLFFNNNGIDKTFPVKSAFRSPFHIRGGTPRITSRRDDVDKLNNPGWETLS